ncbi:hypothetical protein Tco_0498306, partial [Tanacetum coccineum]
VSESSTSSQQDQDNHILMMLHLDLLLMLNYKIKMGLMMIAVFRIMVLLNQQVNTASPEVNTGSREVSIDVPEVNIATPEDLMGLIPTSEDTQVEDQEIELGSISPSYA